MPPKKQPSLSEKIQEAYSFADRASSQSALHYLQHVVIDARPEARKFSDLAEPWQWGLANAIAPAMELVAGVRKEYTGPRNFWLTLPRGHDKTTSIGRWCSWALAYCRRRISGIVAAADREQAGLILEFMDAEVKLNPWLSDHLHFKQHEVEGAEGSKLRVISADAFSSFGLKTDFIVVDELTHWPKRDLWDALFSGREKRPDSVLIVITNAGVLGTWQHDVLQAAKEQEDSWFVYEAPGCLASWMNADAVDRLRKMLPPAVARRVIDNEWLDMADESGLCPKEHIDTCEALGRNRGLRSRDNGEPGKRYVASIDYGPIKDRTVAVVGHKEGDAVHVDKMDVWQGEKGNPVLIETVEKWIQEVNENFNLELLVLDPYQLEGTYQKFRFVVPVEKFEPRGGKSNYVLAESLRFLLVNQKILWPHGLGDLVVQEKSRVYRHTFADELKELAVRVMSYGYRIQNLPGKHDDRCCAVGMMAVHLLNKPVKKKLWTGATEESSLWF